MSKQDVVRLEGEKPEPSARSRRRFLAGLLIGGLVGSLLVGGIGAYSYAHNSLGLRFHGGYHRHGTHDAETVGKRAEFATDWILSRVDASEEQRLRVNAIVQDAINDLFPMLEQHGGNRQALRDALVQPTIDREALGEIRRAELQFAEAASDRLVKALADAAEVLTPEQRSKLAELAGRFHN